QGGSAAPSSAPAPSMDPMRKQPALAADPALEDGRAARAPWLPLVVIVLAQLQMAISINALPVSLGPISRDLGPPATGAATALLLYSLFCAALVMPGARIGRLVGERRVFQAAAIVAAQAGSRLVHPDRCRIGAGRLHRGLRLEHRRGDPGPAPGRHRRGH